MDLNQKIRPSLIITILISLSALFTLVAAFKLNNLNAPAASEPQITVSKKKLLEKNILIDVEGAVVRPGVYELKPGSRLLDAVKKAQGLNALADRYLIAKNFNLAKRISDEEKIYLPFLDERDSYLAEDLAATLININIASATQLELLPGIGQVRAQKIIDNRPYTGFEELISKKVIGEATLQKIIDLIIL